MAVTTKKKALPPVKYVKTDPENLHLSKNDFIAKRKAEKIKNSKLKQFGDELDKEESEAKAAAKSKSKGKK